MLTLWGRVTHLCSFDLYHHCFRQWLVLCAALPNSYRILFQHRTRSSFEASQALSWRSIGWHQSMWTIEELSSLPRTHFRTRPGSSSKLAQIIFWVCPGSHSMLPQDPLPTSKNPSGWIICMLTDLLPSNNMLQTLVSQDQLRLQDWLRTYPYNSLSIYRECRLMVRPHEGPFRSHWNKNVGIFNCTRGCQNDNAWCESTDEQVVTPMTFPFQWA